MFLLNFIGEIKEFFINTLRVALNNARINFKLTYILKYKLSVELFINSWNNCLRIFTLGVFFTVLIFFSGEVFDGRKLVRIVQFGRESVEANVGSTV